MKKKEKLPFSVSLVIPLYNNEKTLVSQLNSCKKILNKLCDKFEIIIAEDKSTDNSKFLLKKRFAKDKNFKLIFHSQNRGIAKTILELYKKASLDFVFLFSVDGDWDPKDIEKLIIYKHKKNTDIIIGKRCIDSYSMYRKVISFMYNFLPLVLFHVNTIDAGSIKIFKRKIIEEIPLVSSSIFFEAELLIKAKKNGYTILSCPINFKKIEKQTGQGGDIKLVLSSIYDLLKLRFTT